MSNPPLTIRLTNSGELLQIEVDGNSVSAYAGESVAAVLMAEGQSIFTPANPYHLSRTLFCGMGICHQCLVTVDGVRDVRACMTKIRAGMKIETSLSS